MAGKSMTWTPEQTAVITSAAGSRLLVDAGPGTGKTATACARIAWLMKSAQLEPSEIWLVSFTRTAVRELRDRIASYCDGADKTAGMRIATIDAHAWAINSGFDPTASMSGTFENNIQRVIELIRNHEGVFEYLTTVRHLVVDEAQDVVGPRCELLLELIHALPVDCGVSIFSDEAQAIYDFADGDGDDEEDDLRETGITGNLPDQIRQHMPDFKCFDLATVHRTTDPKLKKVFSDGRRIIRNAGGNGASKLSEVKNLVRSFNHGDLANYRKDLETFADDDDNTFLLFRRRGEALTATYCLKKRPHRLRMSGLPSCIDSRIALIFWDWTEPFIDERLFSRRYAERLSTGCATELWRTLVHLFGPTHSRLSVTNMVRRLSSGSPPLELLLPEFGCSTGPIIGTIHGAKGREAAAVRLYIPPDPYNPTDERLAEAARLLFVGATRACCTLKIGTGATKLGSKRLKPSGRSYSPWHGVSPRANVEVGRVRDVDAAGLVGRKCFPTPREAEAAQQRVQASAKIKLDLSALLTNKSTDFRFRVVRGNERTGETICFLGTGLNNDLFSVAALQGARKPPSSFTDLWSYGMRTLALASDDPERELLHPPWRDSGIVAAPMVLGYPLCFFRY
jgi:hypothetical protein